MTKIPYTDNEKKLLDKFEAIKKRNDVKQYVALKNSPDVEMYYQYQVKVAGMEAVHKAKQAGKTVKEGAQRAYYGIKGFMNKRLKKA